MSESLGDRMASAAVALLELLDGDARATAVFPVDDDDGGDGGERTSWHYRPVPRNGLAVADMGWRARQATFRLVATGVGRPAYAAVAAIVALEDVLDDREGRRRGRHAEDYAVSLFGDPTGDEPWGWRFEGHHVSLHHTVAGGQVRSAPQFLGANPARIDAEGHVVVRPLAAEDELARAVLAALSPAERRAAVVDPEAPADILTGNARRVDGRLEPLGLAAAELGGAAASLLDRLLDVYLSRLPAEPASSAGRAVRDAGDLHLAWAGGSEPGQPHYYRLQGGPLLVEYDNTQDGANHAHSVVRLGDADFGRDLLAEHRATHGPSTGDG